MAAIDSFRAISDVSPNRGQLWRFLGTLSAQLLENNCPGLLVGEYSLPRDLDLPELDSDEESEPTIWPPN